MSSEMTRIDKPWGHETIFARTDQYVGKIIQIEPGEALSLQYHEIKEETILVIEGEMDLEIREDDTVHVYRLGSGMAYHIPPGTIHRFLTESGCRIVEVSTPFLEDVVRLQDRYGRI